MKQRAQRNQFTNRRNCTLIANPIAMKVAINEARPALINGKGTPMTGRIPSAMPMLIKIWQVNPPTTAIITNMPIRSGARLAPAIIRESNNA